MVTFFVFSVPAFRRRSVENSSKGRHKVVEKSSKRRQQVVGTLLLIEFSQKTIFEQIEIVIHIYIYIYMVTSRLFVYRLCASTARFLFSTVVCDFCMLPDMFTMSGTCILAGHIPDIFLQRVPWEQSLPRSLLFVFCVVVPTGFLKTKGVQPNVHYFKVF